MWTTLRRILAALCLVLAGIRWTAAGGQTGDSAQAATLHQPSSRTTAASFWLPPSQADIAAAISAAAQGALPDGYPSLDVAPEIPPVVLDAMAWVESTWRQFDSSGHPLINSAGAAGIMQLNGTIDGWPDTPEIHSALINNYVYNIAAGAHELAAKWLQTPIAGDGDPGVIENWYYAIWAYNDWGWRNNPHNPIYTRTGTPLTNPWAYPYQERVFYLIAHPPRNAQGVPLWPAVPVTLPSLNTIKKIPVALPVVATPHYDPSFDLGSPPALSLPVGDNARDTSVVANATETGLGTGTGNQTIPVMATTDISLTALAAGLPTVLPDHDVVQSWQLQNTGGTFWATGTGATGGYRLRLISGWPGIGVRAVALPDTVPPLGDVTLQSPLHVPHTSGLYEATWRMENAQGQLFGPLLHTWTHVGSTIHTASNPAVPASSHPATEGNDAQFAGDTGVVDGAVVLPGHAFHKGWLMRNIGTTTWWLGFHLHFEAGEKMGPTISVRAPNTPPGSVAPFDVTLIAPTRPGRYVGVWQMTDPTGRLFGQQVWVIINVVGQASDQLTAGPTESISTETPQPPIVAPTATPTEQQPPAQQATATSIPPTATNTATRVPTHLPTRVPTHTPARVPTRTPNQPSSGGASNIALLGGATPAPLGAWLGPVVTRRYFAEGYTGGYVHEYLSLFNPGVFRTLVRLTLTRIDGASRMLLIQLQPFSRQTISINVLAPRTSTALVLEADHFVVAERAMYVGTGGDLSAGTTQPATRWTFIHWLIGTGYDEWIPLFNPGDSTSYVRITLETVSGATRRISATVPAHRRINVHISQYLGSVAEPGRPAGPTRRIVVEASSAIVAEHVAYFHAPTGFTAPTTEHTGTASPQSLHVATAAQAPQTILAHSGSTAASTTWYFPSGRTDGGRLEYVPVYNPNPSTVMVTITVMLADGSWIKRWLPVGAGAWHVYDVHHLAQSTSVGTQIEASLPVLAQEAQYLPARRGAALTEGVDHTSRAWFLSDGYTANGFDEVVSVLNPGSQAAVVDVRYATNGPAQITRHLVVSAGATVSWNVGADVPAGSVSVAVRSSQPVAVSRMVAFENGWGASTLPGTSN